MALGRRPQPRPEPPPPMLLTATAWGPDGAIVTQGDAYLIFDQYGPDRRFRAEWVTPGPRLRFGTVDPIPNGTNDLWQAHLYIENVPGCADFYTPVLLHLHDPINWPDGMDPSNVQLLASHVDPPLPTFTRDQVCGAQLTFCGLMINTPEWGSQPWFELAYQCNDQSRALIRQQKKAAGDTAVLLSFFTQPGQRIYDEPGQWLQPLASLAGEWNPQDFRSLVLEVLADNMVPIISMDGDNGMDPTNGAPNALRQWPILAELLNDVRKDVLIARFFDGVFYGATPESIREFGRAVRASWGNDANLAIQHNPGHIPVGNGPADYRPGGMMEDYDVIVSEMDWPAAITPPPAIIGATWNADHGGYVPVFAGDASPWMNIWQIVARCQVGYRAPANQPFDVPAIAQDGPQQGQAVQVSSDTRNPQCYLAPMNARGKYFYWMMEDGLYQFVRRQNTVEQLRQAGAYYRSMGIQYVGLPR